MSLTTPLRELRTPWPREIRDPILDVVDAAEKVVALLTTVDGLNIPQGEAPKLHARLAADSALAALRSALEREGLAPQERARS